MPTVTTMPTASTSQILGNNETMEPITSNMYKRRTLAGQFTVINKYLVKDLLKLKLWNNEIKEKIIHYNGSIQNINEIPNEIKKLYKTVWEIKQKEIIYQAADRGAYIDQSQSMNIYMENPDINDIVKLLFTGHRLGLKTGVYYLHSKPSAQAKKITISDNVIKKEKKKKVCDDLICLSCGA